MENEKAPLSGSDIFEKLREFVADKDIVFVTPKAGEVSIPMPTFNEMMLSVQLPEGGLKRGELTLVRGRSRSPYNPMLAYQMLGRSDKGVVRICLEDSDIFPAKKEE